MSIYRLSTARGRRKQCSDYEKRLRSARKVGASFCLDYLSEVKAYLDFRKLLTSLGLKREDFLVSFSLSNVSDVEHFVGRKTELAEIHKALSGNGSRRVVVLHGLGGIGKTQLSVAYAKQHKDDYSAIFWLNIKDEDSLKQSFLKVAKGISRGYPSALRLSKAETHTTLDEVVDTVQAWLSLPNNTRWLMIYDNYDNPKLPGKTGPAAVDIRRYLPESYQGSIIITTRSSQVKHGHVIHVRKLREVRESLEILSNALKQRGLIEGKEYYVLQQ